VEAIGSTPGRKAFKMIIADDGTFYGTVGGGAIEYKVVEMGRELIKKKTNHFQKFNLKEIGMICGGEISVFFEYMAGGKYLYICGGGHVCQAIEPIAKSLGFNITVIDNRKDVAVRELHPSADEIVCGEFDETIKNMQIRQPAYAIILTNKHIHDGDSLKALLSKDDSFEYIGMIGSRNKVKTCLENIKDINQEKLDKVYTPIGLNIGGETPAEIAVGIMAEIISLQYGRNVPHMKN
jgi:xanthine dehydrogenase accessory factor